MNKKDVLEKKLRRKLGGNELAVESYVKKGT